jgi:hypothetical protein
MHVSGQTLRNHLGKGDPSDLIGGNVDLIVKLNEIDGCFPIEKAHNCDR